MPQQQLNDGQTHTRLEQMSRERMPQGMDSVTVFDLGSDLGAVIHPSSIIDRHGTGVRAVRKQPLTRLILLSGLFDWMEAAAAI